MYITQQFLNMSPTRAVQQTREHLSASANPIKDANNVVFDLTASQSPFQDNEEAAIMYAQYVVEGFIKKRVDVTGYAKERVTHHMKINPKFFQGATRVGPSTVITTPKMVENVRVEIKANGKIKKGGKQDIAEHLYKTEVIAKGISNADFVKLLQEKASMTLYGARTYAHNMKKKFGTTS